MSADPSRSPGMGQERAVRAMSMGALAGFGYALALFLAIPPVGLWPMALVAVLPLHMVADARSAHAPRARLRFRVLGAGIGSAPFWYFTHRWIGDISMAGLPPMVAALSCFPAIFVAMLGFVSRRIPALPVAIAGPILWTGLEFFRSRVAFDGYPWFCVTQPLIDAAPLRAVASVGGLASVSLLACVPAGIVTDLWRSHRAAREAPAERRALRLGAASLAALAVAVVAIAAMLSRAGMQHPGPPVAIVVMQTNLPSQIKLAWPPEQRVDDMLRWLDLSAKAVRAARERGSEPIVVVWPETMFPGSSLDAQAVAEDRRSLWGWVLDDGTHVMLHEFSDALTSFQGSLAVPMLVGSMGYDGYRFVDDASARIDGNPWVFDRVHNSAFLLRDGKAPSTRYDKLHLTPFGEVMPYISRWQWLEKKLLALGAQGMPFDLSNGARPVRFIVPGQDGRAVSIATPICFEATMPHVVRALALGTTAESAPPADLLINLTNDGWFGPSNLPRLWHMQLARWRCVELGLPMVRAANTGISSTLMPSGSMLDPVLAVDAQGVLRTEADQLTPSARAQREAAYVFQVPLAAAASNGPRTVAARIGDLLGWLTLALSAAVLPAAFMSRA